jgi:prepilin-type N-terminal cleavage/methylation domain-containing protein
MRLRHGRSSSSRAEARETVVEDQDGFSLIEVLMAVAVMGIGFVGILGAMATSTLSSGLHRTQVVAELEVRRYAELVAAANYTDAGYCADLAGCPGNSVGYQPPDGTDARFNFTAPDPIMTCVSSAAATVPCAGANVQILTVSVHSVDGAVDESLQVVKRKAS